MFRQFPTLFRPANRENLLVFSEKGRVVCHIGMTFNTLCISGCLVRVACVGAVATAEDCRGRGLASRLLDHAAAHARERGALLMLISGGRGLYLRAQAVPVGQHVEMLVPPEAGARLGAAGISMRPFEEEDLPVWQDLYRARSARYLRPPEDWADFERTRLCIGRPVDWWTIDAADAPCAYCVVEPRQGKPALVHESAGDQWVLAAAIPALLKHYAPSAIGLRVHPCEAALQRWLLSAGARQQPPGEDETLLVLDAVGLAAGLWPFFEEKAGRGTTGRLMAAGTRDGGLVLRMDCGGERTCGGPAETARFLFGSPGSAPEPEWAPLVHVPLPAYGLNFI